MKFVPFAEGAWFTPGFPGKHYPPAMPALGLSGIYAIADLAGGILYVGYSRSGRLRGTMARHLRHWEGPRAGPSYQRQQVQLAWRAYDVDQVDIYKLEAEAIEWYKPKDNDLVPVEEEPPF